MTAHLLVPSLDDERPATLSPAIVTGLLKEKLGFEGVVFTDDIGMKAISDALRHAGGDACSRSPRDATSSCCAATRQEPQFAALEARHPRGRGRHAAAEARRGRARAASPGEGTLPRAPAPPSARRRALRTLLGRDEHQAVAAEMARFASRMRKPRALRPGDRIAIVAPASPFARDEFDAGVSELRSSDSSPCTATPCSRATATSPVPADCARAPVHRRGRIPTSPASSPRAAATAACSCCRCSTRGEVRGQPKAFVGYSDNTSLLTWLTQACGMVAFHGPMIEGRLRAGRGRATTATRSCAACRRAEPVGEICIDGGSKPLQPGEAARPAGRRHADAAGRRRSARRTRSIRRRAAILFLDEVAERPYRLDRMLTQLRLAGILARASAIVFDELPGCDEPGGSHDAQDDRPARARRLSAARCSSVCRRDTPTAPALTLPFGVRGVA